ncbi:hypothetical protein [Microbacterium sp. BLY]|uniref:FitA-like ribbon-helix-helix domain-containing protein n=1 Tax=Microbacterium sp. BLY TaxID=2823280 RepID=UPI001B3436EE|nr:hypothetical protein [Microbacterium sp. BLY]MBP3977269.1 hypothetical protein [Microbacterium sp. BLY]
MPNVLIRDLDPGVHSVLAARARERGQSLQQYLSAELARLAARPPLSEFLSARAGQPEATALTPETIVAAVHEGRAGR